MTDPWTLPINTVFAAPGGDLILDVNNGPANDLVINPGSSFMKARIVLTPHMWQKWRFGDRMTFSATTFSSSGIWVNLFRTSTNFNYNFGPNLNMPRSSNLKQIGYMDRRSYQEMYNDIYVPGNNQRPVVGHGINHRVHMHFVGVPDVANNQYNDIDPREILSRGTVCHALLIWT